MSFSIERQHDVIDAAEMMAIPEVSVAVNEMLAELKRARNIHPCWPLDPVHQIAILMEEAGEAMREANDMVHKGADVGAALRNELIQTGAMAIRCLINMEGTRQ